MGRFYPMARGASVLGKWNVTYYMDSSCTLVNGSHTAEVSTIALAASGGDVAGACEQDPHAPAVYWQSLMTTVSNAQDVTDLLSTHAGHGLVVGSFGNDQCNAFTDAAGALASPSPSGSPSSSPSPQGVPLAFSWSLQDACVYSPQADMYFMSSCSGEMAAGSPVSGAVSMFDDANCTLAVAQGATTFTFAAMETCWKSGSMAVGYGAMGAYSGGYCQAEAASGSWVPTLDPTSVPSSSIRSPTSMPWSMPTDARSDPSSQPTSHPSTLGANAGYPTPYMPWSMPINIPFSQAPSRGPTPMPLPLPALFGNVDKLAGTYGVSMSSGDGGLAASASFNSPSAMVVDKTRGKLYFLANNQVK